MRLVQSIMQFSFPEIVLNWVFFHFLHFKQTKFLQGLKLNSLNINSLSTFTQKLWSVTKRKQACVGVISWLIWADLSLHGGYKSWSHPSLPPSRMVLIRSLCLWFCIVAHWINHPVDLIKDDRTKWPLWKQCGDRSIFYI